MIDIGVNTAIMIARDVDTGIMIDGGVNTAIILYCSIVDIFMFKIRC